MKTLTTKVMSTFIVMATTVATFSGATAFANDEQYLNSDPIDVTGRVVEAAEPTDQQLESFKAELRRQKNEIRLDKKKTKTVEKLADTTEKWAETKEESIVAMKHSNKLIEKYNKKIECLVNENKGRECAKFIKRGLKQDKVSTAQAAPVKQVVKEVKKPSVIEGKIKLIPVTGLTTYMSENENLEASVSLGLKVESNITSHVSVGAGINYNSLATKDYANTQFVNNGYSNVYNSFYNGREITYKNLSLDLYSKYFFVTGNRFKPYIGAGVKYNRSSMEYTDNRSLNNSYSINDQFGGEKINSTSLSFEAMLGSEISFTKNFGMNIELQYVKGIGSNLSAENGVNLNNAPDQRRLESLSKELSNANIVSAFAGILVKF